MIRDYDQYEIDLKQRLARYPWIEDEMGERKTECCKRLHCCVLGFCVVGLPQLLVRVLERTLSPEGTQEPSDDGFFLQEVLGDVVTLAIGLEDKKH